ncbi:unnamed protein product [Cylindrotheca closterium]|uniref:Uncharacterized protein n=1 Tax=Cylindrotheca closterium TaxID=2856 RepID=A0AAD2FVC7_9STRA|nr:unnamed protein product [Cylindrotheca closterium]
MQDVDEKREERKRREASRRKGEADKRTKSRDGADREAKRRARRPDNSSSNASKSREQTDRDAKRKARSGKSVDESKDSLSRSARDRDRKSKHRGKPNKQAAAPGAVQEYNGDESDRPRRSKASGSNRKKSGAVPNSPTSPSSKIRAKLDNMEDLKPEEAQTSLRPEPETTTIAGSLVEGDDTIVATAVDEQRAVKPWVPTPTPGQEHQQQQEPPTSSPPPKTPFYCKGGFWIVVLLILAAAGVGIFFATQSDSETPVPANETNNTIGTEKSITEATKTPTTSPSFLPSVFPSTSPTETVVYDPPSPADCAAVSRGDDLVGQEDLNLQTFTVPMDVVLSTSLDDEIVRVELQERIQALFMPELIGCFLDTRRVRGRQLVSSPYTVANGKVMVQARPDTPCTRSIEPKCLHVSASLDLYVRGSERPFDLISLIVQVLGPEALLVSNLSLQQPFVEIFIVTVASGIISLAPSSTPTAVSSENPTLFLTESPSTDPTTAPVTFPTTEEPTGLPTVAPIVLATPEPSLLPSSGPTFAPVTDPTPIPTPPPTPVPTEAQSQRPSETPTATPSDMPTGMPSQSPSTSPPTPSPSTPQPTGMPTRSPTLAPSSNPSFGAHGNQFTSSTYAMFSYDLSRGASNAERYEFGTRQAAVDGCARLGLDLCPKIAIENSDVCAGGWLTDGKGYWITNPRIDCAPSPGYVDWSQSSIRIIAGAWCCGRPLLLPRDFAYIYTSVEEARAACATEGLGLCTKEQIVGADWCAYGWLESGEWGLWSSGSNPSGCGSRGLLIGGTEGTAGAYCCATYYENQFTSSTYVMFSYDLSLGAANAVRYEFSTREAAVDGCARLGLDLCPKIAIENSDICAAGWLTDGKGYWITNPRGGCAVDPGYVDWLIYPYANAGAWCCGRPLLLPRDFTSVEEARVACATEGLGLCTKEQIVGADWCTYGWLESGERGLWSSGSNPSGCGSRGLVMGGTEGTAGAYCCATYGSV